MIGLLSMSTGNGGIFNRQSPVWYATAPMKVKGFSDALFPEQGVKLDAKNDQGLRCGRCTGSGRMVRGLEFPLLILLRRVSTALYSPGSQRRRPST